MKVAVLYNDDAAALTGGNEADRLAVAGAVAQARAVAAALERRGHEVKLVAARDRIVAVAEALLDFAPEVVFNSCESFAGSAALEAAVAGLLDLLGLRFTGSPLATLVVAQDKARARAVLAAAGIPVAAGGLLAQASDPLPPGIRFPAFVKLRREDASHGIEARNLCRDEAELRARAAELIAEWRQDVVVEEFLPGRELNIAVLGDVVLPVAEIDYRALPPGVPAVLTYEAKWAVASPLYQQTPAVCPAPLEESLRAAVARLALDTFAAIGCRGYARVDVRLDGAGRPVVLEVNPNPDVSPDAGFARAASRAGIAYDELIERIVQLAAG